MLERSLGGLISNIRSLDAPGLAEDLSANFAVVKSMLDELDLTTTSGRDAFIAKVANFYVMTRDATQA